MGEKNTHFKSNAGPPLFLFVVSMQWRNFGITTKYTFQHIHCGLNPKSLWMKRILNSICIENIDFNDGIKIVESKFRWLKQSWNENYGDMKSKRDDDKDDIWFIHAVFVGDYNYRQCSDDDFMIDFVHRSGVLLKHAEAPERNQHCIWKTKNNTWITWNMSIKLLSVDTLNIEVAILEYPPYTPTFCSICRHLKLHAVEVLHFI